MKTIDWAKAVKPLIKKYSAEPHPLHANSLYEMLVMVILSAQTTDNIVNLIAPDFFKSYPSMASIAAAKPEDLHSHLSKVRNFAHKADWLVKIAMLVQEDSKIPLDIKSLVLFPGIGRKSANVIKRYAGAPIEGIVVDLHTVRVSNRLGIVSTEDPKKIEEQMMRILPKSEWDVGMSMSFLGRDICRPKPDCLRCLMKDVCAYFQEHKMEF